MSFRNPYAARLNEFSEFAFDGEAIRAHRGQWAGFFSRQMGKSPQKIVFEIGCSNGNFLTSVAAEQLESAFVGIDWKFKVLYKAAKRLSLAPVKNGAFLRGKGQEIHGIFGPAELDEIWILFPDPWAKKGQLKNRLIQDPFLKDAAAVLKPGGRICFKTDHPGYYQWVLALWGRIAGELPEYDQVLDEKSRRARQVQVRRLMDPELLPEQSVLARELFTVGQTSIDFWTDRPNQAPEALLKHPTLFEKLFVQEKLPIYYVELIRK